MSDHLCGHSDQPQSVINVSEPERFASAIGGGFLLAGGLLYSSKFMRLAALLAGGGLIYRGLSGHCMLYQWMGSEKKGQVDHCEAQIDDALEDSFPASDPPAFTSSVASRSME